jgi:transposase
MKKSLKLRDLIISCVRSYHQGAVPHTLTFNLWLETILLPSLPRGTTLIMDNAAFHKSLKTKELIEKSGCHLLFLPTYSPDLNPIEHWWHKIKSILRPLIQNASDTLHNILDQCLLTI